MSLDWLNLLAIPIQVAQIGSLPWLLALLIALNSATAVLAIRALGRAYLQARHIAQMRTRLMSDVKRQPHHAAHRTETKNTRGGHGSPRVRLNKEH